MLTSAFILTHFQSHLGFELEIISFDCYVPGHELWRNQKKNTRIESIAFKEEKKISLSLCIHMPLVKMQCRKNNQKKACIICVEKKKSRCVQKKQQHRTNLYVYAILNGTRVCVYENSLSKTINLTINISS